MRFIQTLAPATLALAAGAPAHAQGAENFYTGEIHIQVKGPEKTVWFNDGSHPPENGNQCQLSDTPDMPAIALRDHKGGINLYGGGFLASYRLVGTSLSVNPSVRGHLRRVCHEIFRAGWNEPGGWEFSNFSNHDWVTGLYADETSGRFVYCLLQNEFWGESSPIWGEYCYSNCPNAGGVIRQCWVNSVTAAHSVDGGESFVRGGFAHKALAENFYIQGPDVVARIMSEFVPCQGRSGYFAPTNIVRMPETAIEGTHFRAMIEADATASPEVSLQPTGMCVIQCGVWYVEGREMPDGVWRAWGGKAFDRNLAEGDVAEVVGANELKGLLIKNLFYLKDLELFVGLGSLTDMQGTGNVSIYYSTSRDMITWTPKQKLLDSGSLPGTTGVTLYPSLINHGAKTKNMSSGLVTDQEIHLYMVRRLSPPSVNQVHRAQVRAPVHITLLAK